MNPFIEGSEKNGSGFNFYKIDEKGNIYYQTSSSVCKNRSSRTQVLLPLGEVIPVLAFMLVE